MPITTAPTIIGSTTRYRVLGCNIAAPARRPNAQAITAADTPKCCITITESYTDPKNDPSVDQYSAVPLA